MRESFTAVPRLPRVALLLLVAGCAPAAARAPATLSRPNEVVRFLAGAERQAENDAQAAELRRGLEDLRTLSSEELHTRRYADYQMRPGQWTLAALLARYFVPAQPQAIDESALYRDAQEREARELVALHIRAIDERRQVAP